MAVEQNVEVVNRNNDFLATLPQQTAIAVDLMRDVNVMVVDLMNAAAHLESAVVDDFRHDTLLLRGHMGTQVLDQVLRN